MKIPVDKLTRAFKMGASVKKDSAGTKIRLRGKGIVAMNNPSVHGDEYATVQIEVPTNLTPEARRKLKEFEQECNGSRRSRGFGSGSAA